jgi:hypothetical protein
MRRAILHELLQPLDPDEPPPACKLQAVVRAVVNKASQGDLTAAKEILDRIDGKTATAPHPLRPKLRLCKTTLRLEVLTSLSESS